MSNIKDKYDFALARMVLFGGSMRYWEAMSIEDYYYLDKNRIKYMEFITRCYDTIRLFDNHRNKIDLTGKILEEAIHQCLPDPNSRFISDHFETMKENRLWMLYVDYLFAKNFTDS